MNPMMIVVADSTRARIFTAEPVSSSLEEVETFANPEGRMHEQDMVSDLPGKEAGKGGGGDHAFQEKVEPKQQKVIEFAKRVADYLDDVRKDNKLGKLLLIAAPDFLGELRNHLSNETREKVTFELDKNLAHHDEEDIRNHLP
jgi:protein required for attachment to host cells